MPNASGGMCGLLTLISLWLLSVGIPYDTVFAAVNGELSREMKEKVQWLREAIVEKSNDHPACDRLCQDGTKESRSLEESLKCAEPLETKEMWDNVTLHPEGHIDGMGMVIGAQVVGLDGFRVAEAGEGGRLQLVDGWHDKIEAKHLALHHKWGHWEVLLLLLVRQEISIYCSCSSKGTYSRGV
ncbi:unnamed protein product [Ectocarpus sp. 12 AP-2014]